MEVEPEKLLLGSPSRAADRPTVVEPAEGIQLNRRNRELISYEHAKSVFISDIDLQSWTSICGPLSKPEIDQFIVLLNKKAISAYAFVEAGFRVVKSNKR